VPGNTFITKIFKFITLTKEIYEVSEVIEDVEYIPVNILDNINNCFGDIGTGSCLVNIQTISGGGGFV